MSKAPILFAGGGSGGHIVPLLAVMGEVRRLDPDRPCIYVGQASDLQSPLLDASGLTFARYSITAGKLHRFLTPDQLRQGYRAIIGLIQAERLVGKLKPAAVLCKGSMLSFPIAKAAARRGIPVFTHETDVVPGLANRLVARYAKRIFTSFPVDWYDNLLPSKLQATGQPVRAAFYHPSPTFVPLIDQGRVGKNGLPLLVVIGGSQGARRLNRLVQGAWPTLLASYRVVHLCGSLDYDELYREAARMNPHLRQNLYLSEFLLEGMPELFASASLAISRAGGTVFELAASETPTVLVPLSTAAQGHQLANAKVLEAAGAAKIFLETGTNSEKLVEVVCALMDDAAERRRLSEAISTFARPEAAEEMARTILEGLE
ncbi:MAG: UDP-N-acetylglucosamine--N-acetylmuramyl-(pentapeptide) pyrophosphoryl-undecaprenol N-acetylglucosamine transferase [bacterium]